LRQQPNQEDDKPHAKQGTENADYLFHRTNPLGKIRMKGLAGIKGEGKGSRPFRDGLCGESLIALLLTQNKERAMTAALPQNCLKPCLFRLDARKTRSAKANSRISRDSTGRQEGRGREEGQAIC
jgi:hypothetical protein